MRILALVSLLVSSCLAQQDSPFSANSPTPSTRLEIGNEGRRLSQTSAPLAGPVMCDDQGGIYLRPMGPTTHPMRAPVIRVDRNNQHTMFDLSSLSGVKGDAYVFAYTVDPSGQLVALVRVEDQDKPSMFIASFSSRGMFSWKTPVDGSILPSSILTLPSGDLLISGIERNKGTARDFVRVYSREGVIKHTLFSGVQQRVTSGGVVTMPLGASRIGRNQQIYVLRGGPKPRIAVYGLDGEQLSMFRLKTPFPGAQAFELYLSGSRALVSFQRPASTRKDKAPKMRIDHVLYDLSTGEAITDFVQEDPGILACVADKELTWLVAGRDGFFEIRSTNLAH